MKIKLQLIKIILTLIFLIISSFGFSIAQCDFDCAVSGEVNINLDDTSIQTNTQDPYNYNSYDFVGPPSDASTYNYNNTDFVGPPSSASSYNYTNTDFVGAPVPTYTNSQVVYDLPAYSSVNVQPAVYSYNYGYGSSYAYNSWGLPTVPTSYTPTNWNAGVGVYNSNPSVGVVYNTSSNYNLPTAPTAQVVTNTNTFVATDWNASARNNTASNGTNNRVIYNTPTAPISNTNTNTGNSNTFTPTNWNAGLGSTANNTNNRVVYNSGNVTYSNTQVNSNSGQQNANTYTPTNWNSGIGSNVNNTNNRVVYSSGNVIYSSTSTNYSNSNSSNCQANFELVNGQCVPVRKTCLNGTRISYFESCTKICSDGKVVNEITTCTKRCASGDVVSESNVCPNETQICSDGTVISTNDVCKNKFKTCSTGAVIPVNTICTKICSNGSVVTESDSCPSLIYDVNVISSVDTTPTNQVTRNSARCNALAILGQGVDTVGYFEYGITKSLGKYTNSAKIGNSRSVSFSNIITDLASSTTYYCRAVISNKFGTYKGDIVSFKTLGSNSNYISQILTTKTTSKTEVKSSVVCTDDTGTKVKIDESGQVLTLKIERLDSKVTSGDEVKYKVTYQNNTKLKLSNVYVKVSIPDDLEYVSTNVGNVEDGYVKLDINNVSADSNDEATLVFRVKDNVKAGTSILTSVYGYYEMLDESGKKVSDESGSYDIFTVSDKSLTSSFFGNSNSNSTSTKTGYTGGIIGFIFKWIIIILLVALLLLTGRYVYKAIRH